MRPGNRRQRNGALRISKEKTKKIGKRSIYDLIHNSFDLTFYEKVDYIRHHYVYYDGNYEYFHDENGKPNARKRYLNCLIMAILNENDDPSKLTDFNEQIMRWRKKSALKEEVEARIEKLEELSIDISDINNHGWKKEADITGVTNQPESQIYIAMIKDFLKSDKNNLSKESILRLSYKNMRKLAKLWKRLGERDMDYEEIVKNGFTIFNEKNTILSEIQSEEDRAANLMKQYDEELKNRNAVS